MVAINFPDSPTNGQEHAGYVWDATNNVWNRLPTLPALDLVNFSAVAPSNPQDGQFWFDTTVGKMYVYYNDGSSSQWVSAIGGLASQTGTTGQVLTYDGTEWVADDPSGKILQVVSTTMTDTFSQGGLAQGTLSNTVTGLTVTITPSSASSKILITGSIAAGLAASTFSTAVTLFRDATAICIGDAEGSRIRVSAGGGTGNGNGGTTTSLNFLDSPNTTSAITYSIKINHANTTTDTVYVNRGQNDSDATSISRSTSTITVMEVAG